MTPATTSPLSTTIAPGTPPASNVIDFFTAPVTTGDERDVALALAGGATRASLGLEPLSTKENADSTKPGGDAEAAGESAAAAANDTSAAGAGEGNEDEGRGTKVEAPTSALQRIVREEVAKLQTELTELQAEPASETTVGRAVQARIAAIQGEMAELNAGVSTKGTKDAKGETEETDTNPVEVPAPTVAIAGRPLALVRDERGLTYLQATAKSVKAWARSNSDGGEMPAELRGAMEKANQLITGNQESKLNLPDDFLDAKAVGHFLGLAEDMLDERIPQQRQFVAAESAAHAAVAKESPAYFDTKKPEGQLVERILTLYPWMRQVPEWPGLVRDLATGFMQNRKVEGKQLAADGKGKVADGKATDTPPVTNTDGKVVPLAPAAPIGGNSSAVPAVTQKALDEAQERMTKGTASDADWRLLTEYAA